VARAAAARRVQQCVCECCCGKRHERDSLLHWLRTAQCAACARCDGARGSIRRDCVSQSVRLSRPEQTIRYAMVRSLCGCCCRSVQASTHCRCAPFRKCAEYHGPKPHAHAHALPHKAHLLPRIRAAAQTCARAQTHAKTCTCTHSHACADARAHKHTRSRSRQCALAADVKFGFQTLCVAADRRQCNMLQRRTACCNTVIACCNGSQHVATPLLHAASAHSMLQHLRCRPAVSCAAHRRL
jgi:hypothetical protein